MKRAQAIVRHRVTHAELVGEATPLAVLFSDVEIKAKLIIVFQTHGALSGAPGQHMTTPLLPAAVPCVTPGFPLVFLDVAPKRPLSVRESRSKELSVPFTQVPLFG